MLPYLLALLEMEFPRDGWSCGILLTDNVFFPDDICRRYDLKVVRVVFCLSTSIFSLL